MEADFAMRVFADWGMIYIKWNVPILSVHFAQFCPMSHNYFHYPDM